MFSNIAHFYFQLPRQSPQKRSLYDYLNLPSPHPSSTWPSGPWRGGTPLRLPPLVRPSRTSAGPSGQTTVLPGCGDSAVPGPLSQRDYGPLRGLEASPLLPPMGAISGEATGAKPRSPEGAVVTSFEARRAELGRRPLKGLSEGESPFQPPKGVLTLQHGEVLGG